MRTRPISVGIASAALLIMVSAGAGCANGALDTTAADPPSATTDLGDAGTSGDGGATRPDPSGSDIDSGSGTDSGGTDGASKDSSGGDSGGTDSGGTDSGGVCAKVPPNNLCGLVPQCGCPANQTCDVTDNVSGSTSCVTAGSGVQGSACSSTGSCALGLTCVFGTCRPYCATPNQACQGANLGQCIDPEYDAQHHTTPNRHVCLVSCDLRNPAAACPNNGCDYFSGSHNTDCRTAGNGTQFATCASHGDCRPGYACASDVFLGPVCMAWCRIGNNGDCGGGTNCTDYLGANAPTQNGSKLGLCD